MKKLELSAIRIDGGTQSRSFINEEIVAEYAEAMRANTAFPPVTIFYDGANHWLADGFHRYHATHKAELSDIHADIRSGTRRDAVLFSVGANFSHGLRRSNEDKRASVKTLIEDAEWSQWSDRQIAAACGVSHPFVAAIRAPKAAERQQENRLRSAGRVESDSIPAPKATQIHADNAPIATPPKLTVIEGGKDAAEVQVLRQQLAVMTAERDELSDRLSEMADDLAGYMKVCEGNDEAAREIKRLLGQLHTVERQRDEQMSKCAEMLKQIKMLERQLRRAGKGAA